MPKRPCIWRSPRRNADPLAGLLGFRVCESVGLTGFDDGTVEGETVDDRGAMAGSVRVLVHPENDSLVAIATEAFSSRAVRPWKNPPGQYRAWDLNADTFPLVRTGDPWRPPRGRPAALLSLSRCYASQCLAVGASLAMTMQVFPVVS